jgi:hypothetical protein
MLRCVIEFQGTPGPFICSSNFLYTISQDTDICGGQQPAQSTGKLMPPLTGIGGVSIHHAAVVQRLPVQLTRRSIPTSLNRKRPTVAASRIHLLHAIWPISWPHLAGSKRSPCLQRVTKRDNGDQHVCSDGIEETQQLQLRGRVMQ